MRASRLLNTLLLLSARGRITARELADELEVSIRTVYRDIESLSAAGIPVYADRGAAGGYRLLDGYRTKLTGLTAGEVESLLFAGMPNAATDLGLGEVLATAQLKFSAALPSELRSAAERIRQLFYLDPAGWFRGGDTSPLLAMVADAVWSHRLINVDYQRWDRSRVKRKLAPLGVVLKGGTWYLVARTTGEPHIYRVSRIHYCEILGERFQRPADFDLARFWSTRERQLTEALYRGEAVIRLSPDARGLLFLLGEAPMRAGLDSMSAPDSDGWVRMTIPIESVKHAHAALLQLGADVEVLEPVELRELIKDTGMRLTRMYSSNSPNSPPR